MGAAMRGDDEICGSLFSYIDLEDRVRADHPLRPIREITNAALAALTGEFAALYCGMGRPSVRPEKLLRAMLLQAFYSVRSERQLMERIEFDLLFRWFVGIGIDDPVWDHSSFSKNRDRLLEGEIAAKFLTTVLSQSRVRRLLSSEHFSVDGTLIQAWASMKKAETAAGQWRAERHGAQCAGRFPRPETLERNASKHNRSRRAALSQGAGHGGQALLHRHGLMENRSGLLVDARLTRVSGYAERLAALDMVQHWADRPCAVTLGADRGYDAADFVEELRALNVRPHVAQNTSGRRSAIDKRTTRHPGYAASLRIRKRIEEAFGWIKSVGGLRQTKLRGLPKADWAFTFAAAAYNLVRLPKLIGATI